MSYVPYHPDVWPPKPAYDPPNYARIYFWTAGVILYLVAIVGWVCWMKLPPTPKAPIAMIAMPNGSELRLLHVNVGKDTGIQSGTTFGNRLPLDASKRPNGGSPDNTGGLWLVFSTYNPSAKRFTTPDLLTVEIAEPDSPYPLRPSRLDSKNGPCLTVLFHAVPYTSPTLPLRITRGDNTVQATIPNPLYQARPANPVPPIDFTSAQPLPQQKMSDGFTARFEQVVFRENPNPRLDQAKLRAEAHCRVTHATAPPDSYYQNYEWFDAGGNVVKSGLLPWSSKVWGLRLLIREENDFPIPFERLFALGTVKVPAPNQVVSLPVPLAFKDAGVHDILLVGTGNYSWSGNNLRATTPTGTVVTVATAAGTPRYGSFSESGWGIYLLSGSKGSSKDDKFRPKIRVRKGDVMCVSGSDGTSAWINVHQQIFSNFRLPKGRNVPVGEEVSIEAFIPKVHQFEFTIPRPEYSLSP